MAILLALALAPAGVSAAPALLWQVPETGPGIGAGAGELNGAQGVATDNADGHVYVADSANARIDEFTAWGEFVKAFGWGVVASGPDDKPQNERQEVTVDATSGSFKLDFRPSFYIEGVHGSGDQTTTSLAYNASAATVQSALEGLESIAPGDVVVTGADGGPWTIEFTGRYADADILQLQAAGTLSGGAASVTVETVQGGAAYEVCEPAKGDVCRSGQYGGTSAGELNIPASVAVDSSGDVYAFEYTATSARVEKFDQAGQFLLMFGGDVDKTTGADVCTKADLVGGDECGEGVPGAATGHFETSYNTAQTLAIGPEGTVYVGDVNRIQEFNSDGVYAGQIGLPTEGEVKGGAREGKGVTESLAVDSAGNIYFDFQQEYVYKKSNQPNMYKYSGTGWSLFAEAEFPQALATDPAGDVYAVASTQFSETHILEFGPDGEKIHPTPEEESEEAKTKLEGGLFTPVFGEEHERVLYGLAASSACGILGEDVYASSGGFFIAGSALHAYGSNPDPSVCPPPVRAPSIADQYATSVGPDAASIRASINPHFWGDTKYELQYGTAPCSLGGCTVVGAGSQLGSESNLPVTTDGLALHGLTPATTYHYRFVAESGGGGPVRGLGGEVGKDGEEGSFTTSAAVAPPPSPDSCSNALFRNGPSVFLPDCRAYEMVSPAEKGNSDIQALFNSIGDPATLDQSSTDGDRITYSTYRAFGDAQSAPYSVQYLATRTAAGWSDSGISPPVGTVLAPLLDVEYRGFTADLCTGWLVHDTNPPLASGATEGYANLYSRGDCAGESYEALTNVAPTVQPVEFKPELQGFSEDGEHVAFQVEGKLTKNASSEGNDQCYESFAGKLVLISVLPSGLPSKLDCSLGSGHGGIRQANVRHAISRDGSRIFWTASMGAGPGQIYARINGRNPTVAVSEAGQALSGGEARFYTAAADGSKVIYGTGGDLYEFDVDTKATTLIAHKLEGFVDASEDASRIYFASGEDLAPSEDGAHGPIPGSPNIYRYQAGPGGGFKFVATIAASEVGGGGALSSVNDEPGRHGARVNPDGSTLVFGSAVPITGYDNTDLNTGKADNELFVYEAGANGGAGAVACVSCAPTGARPVSVLFGEGMKVPVAAMLPREYQTYAPRAMSDSGGRVFFDSFNALTPRDTDGSEDVYEWEVPGEGDCTEHASSYSSPNGGCISLISSGESPESSELIDASASGDDVFFTTASSLASQDPGLIDVYDARVDSELPPQSAQPTVCEGEACQSPPSPPIDATPGSLTFSGAGNALATPPAKAGSTQPKAKTLTAKQKLAKALKACKSKPRKKRAACEALARKRYPVARRSSRGASSSARAHTKGMHR